MNVFLLLMFLSHMFVISLSVEVKCLDKERLALLKFKSELIDDYGRLSTWGTQQDCCKWNGISCHNRTNRVLSLDLHGPKVEDFTLSTPLRGKISPSLLELVYLNYLDLSNNDFGTIEIPYYIGSLHRLHHLNLSHSNFIGSIPQNLGNLSMLQVLDLSGNEVITAADLDWLSGFRSLEYLDLSRLNLLNVTTWLHVINKLTSLKRLNLMNCGIQETRPASSFPSINGSSSSSNSLEFLDLSSNNLDRISILIWFLNFSSTSLTHIDLSSNQLVGEFPVALTYSTSLSYLDLSTNKIEGRIPNSLGYMKSLTYLDLSGNSLEGFLPDILANMTSLSHLDLSGNNLEGGLPRIQGHLSNLSSLDLSENKFDGDITHMTNFLWESTVLEFLDLTSNRFYGSIPEISRFSLLKILSLDRNQLNGSFIENTLSLPYLLILDVSGNRLTGRLPDFASCSSLEVLNLSDNMFNGTLTESIGYLSKLDSLDLHLNRFEGIVSEAHFFNFTQLGILDLSFNPNLTIMINSLWNPPFQLGTLKLANCNLGPNFPKWLQKQRRLAHLDISDAKITDTVPEWFWNNNSHTLDYLNMSHNRIYGEIPNLTSNYVFSMLDLSSNEFTGSLPLLSTAMAYLDLSRNKFSGTITEFCNTTYGRIVLDLSQNLLSGEISLDCFKNLMTLQYLDLGNNNFSGEIPSPSEWYCSFISLHLRNNSFQGQIPTYLKDCSNLEILDLGHNNFTGTIPTWIGDSLLQIGVLSLRSNHFYGTLPSNLCNLANIQVLDLSMNMISGTIPKCVNNFTSMSSKPNSYDFGRFLFLQRAVPSFYDSAYITWKGTDTMYTNTLGLVKVIDLSSNNLVGEIPREITRLVGLIGLNLSRNNLVGPVPREIGDLEFLNFLDLSENGFSGNIPSTLSKLNYLGVLDLSFNNLSGRIPWIDHLQTFGALSYAGNPELCGPPVLKSCPGDSGPGIPMFGGNVDGTDGSENGDGFVNRGFYVSMGAGFIVWFWGVSGALILNKSCWRKLCSCCS